MTSSSPCLLKSRIKKKFVFFSSENLIRTQAELLVQGGYLEAGYQYITIDDCWLSHNRSAVC